MHPVVGDGHWRSLTSLLWGAVAAGTLAVMPAQARAGDSMFFPADAPRDAVVDHLGVLYVSTGASVRRFDTRTRNELTAIPIPQGLPLGLAFDPDGCRLAIADGSSAFNRIWVLEDLGHRTARSFSWPNPPGGQYGSFSVAWNGRDRVLASGRFGGSGPANLRRVDLTSGSVALLASLNQDSMLQMSADQTTLAVSEHNTSAGPVRIFDASGQIPLSWRVTGWFQWEVAISPDAKVVVGPTYNGAYVFDVVGGQLVERPDRLGVYAEWGPIGLVFATHTSAVFASMGAWMAADRKLVAYPDHTLQAPILIDTPDLRWTGNNAYQQGRTRLDSNGRWLSVTLPTGVMVYDVSHLAARPGHIFGDGHECGDPIF